MAASKPRNVTAGPTTSGLARRYSTVRALTATLCETLTPEDCCIQSMRDCSPTRWHLAHTSWFFETFLLKRDPAYRPFDEHYEVLFNSYYNTVGNQFPRDRRGLLSRPTLAEVFDYRRHIDEAVGAWFDGGRIEGDAEAATIVEWGIQHEQQHQELILTDVKHLLSVNPLLPTFRSAGSSPPSLTGARIGSPEAKPAGDSWADEKSGKSMTWIDFPGGLEAIGHTGDGFSYDNESPRHQVFQAPFQLASRPVTSGEFHKFMEDGGYQRPEFWLSAGWSTAQAERWASPLYWHKREGEWHEFTLAGPRPLDVAAPVTHVSYFEADAYARWAGARLPTEAEWEIAGRDAPLEGNFVDGLIASGRAIHPQATSNAATPAGCLAQLFGDVWEWTASPYTPYPGYTPPSGALGEYNGKFMCNQYVLRGGSCATPAGHIRATYRNFFPPDARWQFSGIRLAR